MIEPVEAGAAARPRERRSVRLAAIGDLHCPKVGTDVLSPLLTRIAGEADVLILCGDLTDRGGEEEARALGRALTSVKIPTVAVLGNHDFESGRPEAVTDALADAGVHVLQGDAVEILGIGFAGVKGFGGGFGERALQPWGEALIKAFVREAVEEALRLESALATLRTPHRIGVLHYSPIDATVKGEPPEIFPFLGSSRLEEPLTRYSVTAVFHGHAHAGSPEGRTRADIPVYNVALPLLMRAYPDRPPYRLLDLTLD
jgi:Icc-related predicted phosphoesterase